MLLALLPILALSTGQTVRLYDEGVLLGPVVGIDCVGTGIVCSWSSSLVRGTLTVTGGGGGVPDTIPAITYSSTPDLSAERVLTNGTNTTVDLGTAGQAKVNLSGTVPQTLGGTGAGSLTCSAGQFITSNGTTYSCGTPTGGTNVAQVTVAFGSGNTTASTVVTGQAWVTGTSKILCAPTLLAASGRAEGAEDAIIEGITGAVHTRSAGVGFTLTVGKPGPGLLYGSFIFHCTGT